MEYLLKAWVVSATQGLCEEACWRIHGELQRHVHDMVIELQSEGISEGDASAEALRRLGPPKDARQAFRRTNFTKQEAWLLRRSFAYGMSERDHRKGAYTALTLVTVCAILILAANIWGSPREGSWRGILVCQGILAPTLCRGITRFLLRHHALFLAAMAVALLWAAYCLTVGVVLWGVIDDKATPNILMSVCIGIAYLVILVRIGFLWPKLGQMMPPPRGIVT